MNKSLIPSIRLFSRSFSTQKSFTAPLFARGGGHSHAQGGAQAEHHDDHHDEHNDPEPGDVSILSFAFFHF